MAYLRNPLTWHKRYVEGVYDIPSTPSGVVGRAAHKALEYFYSGAGAERATSMGSEYLRAVPDYEISLPPSKRARKEKRREMEREYLQAISFYLERPPRHTVVGVEVVGMASVPDIPLPIKAVSDLVVESRAVPGALDIVDHKFVDSFSSLKAEKPLFILQALFNYYTVKEAYGAPVERALIYECKKRKNRNGGPQLKRYVIRFSDISEEFDVFKRLLADASEDIGRKRVFLPNPSDMFEGSHSFDIYRLGL